MVTGLFDHRHRHRTLRISLGSTRNSPPLSLKSKRGWGGVEGQGVGWEGGEGVCMGGGSKRGAVVVVVVGQTTVRLKDSFAIKVNFANL